MTEIDHLCRAALKASENVRGAISSSTKEDGVLAAYWMLQDSMHRLLLEASDKQPESVRFLRLAYPGFARKICDVLRLTSSFQVSRAPGISTATDTINESLMALYQLEK